MAIVRDLVTRLGFQVDNRGRANAEGAITRIRDRANDAAMQVRSMLAAFVGFQGLKSIARTADEMQSIEARAGMLTQSVDGSAAAFDHIAERANNARQSISAYSDFYLKAGNATKDFISDQETLTKVVDGAAFGLAASGATAASQSQAFFQLGQAIGSPTVQMEEMNTLIDVAPDLFRALGDAIPGANGNLKAFISTGQVTGKMLAEGLMTVLPQFEEKMRNIPMTIGTATTLMQNKFSQFVAGFNRESQAVTNIANFMLDAFDAFQSGLQKVVDFLGGPTQAIKAFGIALAAALVPTVISVFAGAIALVISPIGLFVAGVTALALAVEDLYQWISGGDSAIGKWLGSFEEWKSANQTLVDSISALWNHVKVFWDNLASLGESVWDILVGLLTADTGRIVDGFKGVFDSISNIFSSWLDGIEAAFTAGWESLKIIAAGLWDISPINAWIQKIKGIVQEVKNYFLDMLSPLTGAFNSAKEFLGFGGGDNEPQTEGKSGGWRDSLPSWLGGTTPEQSAPVYGPEVPVVPPGNTNNTNNNMTQNINVTVPPGTPEGQREDLRRAAGAAFGEGMARDMNTYGP